MSRIIKGSTKKGKELIASAKYVDGYSLSDVYSSYSYEKERSYRWCFEKYMNTPDSDNFHIISHNIFQYSVAWYGTHENEDALFIETANNSYIVLLDK